jgi:hypothetical protein
MTAGPASPGRRAPPLTRPRRLAASPRLLARADQLIYPGRQDDGVHLPAFPAVFAGPAPGGAGAAGAASYSEHKPKTPPPDLPSLLLDSRIVYLGMPVRAWKATPVFFALRAARRLLACQAALRLLRLRAAPRRRHAGYFATPSRQRTHARAQP